MTLSSIEHQRLQDGIRAERRGGVPHFPLHHWRFYFQYLLGRAVSLAETERFLQDEADAQTNAQHQGVLTA